MAARMVYLLGAIATVRAAGGPAVVRVDARATGREWLGFGANVWPGDLAVEPAFRDLRLRWARLWAGMPEGAPGAEGTREQFDAYWATHPGVPGARAVGAMLTRHRAKTVLCIGSPPPEWLGRAYHLEQEFHGAFARNWGAAVLAHVRAGVRPTFVELYNEPDGFWGIHVSPEENAALIVMVREELDRRGLRDVGICGPGTAHADWGPTGDQYVNALGPEAVRALAAWSNHAWEWNTQRIHAEGGGQYLREAWPSVMGAIRRKDPGLRRPVLVTEFATKAHVFHGRAYPDQGSGPGENKASDTPEYAVRVVENALHLIAGGANALLVWEGADQEWSQHEWGLITRPSRGSKPRPVYDALRTVAPYLPEGGRALRGVTATGGVAAAAVRKGSRLVVAVANGAAGPRSARIEVAGVRGLRVVLARAFSGGRARVAAPTVAGCAITAPMPADSTLTVVCEVR